VGIEDGYGLETDGLGVALDRWPSSVVVVVRSDLVDHGENFALVNAGWITIGRQNGEANASGREIFY
jgi:hypothetical protein